VLLREWQRGFYIYCYGACENEAAARVVALANGLKIVMLRFTAET
jgi:hypothetical protein